LTSSGELHFLILRGNTVLTVFSSNRATDFTFTLLVGYAVLPAMFSPVVITRPRLSLAFYFLHALAWRMFHSFGLGFLLKVQSEERWLVRHFLKHYHYPAVQRSSSSKQSKSNSTDLAPGDEAGEDASDDIPAATRDAFDNWKVLYNTSLVMTYG
jgi:phosphatidylethanolamine N-methyltransferase